MQRLRIAEMMSVVEAPSYLDMLIHAERLCWEVSQEKWIRLLNWSACARTRRHIRHKYEDNMKSVRSMIIAGFIMIGRMGIDEEG